MRSFVFLDAAAPSWASRPCWAAPACAAAQGPRPAARRCWALPLARAARLRLRQQVDCALMPPLASWTALSPSLWSLWVALHRANTLSDARVLHQSPEVSMGRTTRTASLPWIAQAATAGPCGDAAARLARRHRYAPSNFSLSAQRSYRRVGCAPSSFYALPAGPQRLIPARCTTHSLSPSPCDQAPHLFFSFIPPLRPRICS
jgi:hypothetical protein